MTTRDILLLRCAQLQGISPEIKCNLRNTDLWYGYKIRQRFVATDNYSGERERRRWELHPKSNHSDCFTGDYRLRWMLRMQSYKEFLDIQPGVDCFRLLVPCRPLIAIAHIIAVIISGHNLRFEVEAHLVFQYLIVKAQRLGTVVFGLAHLLPVDILVKGFGNAVLVQDNKSVLLRAEEGLVGFEI